MTANIMVDPPLIARHFLPNTLQGPLGRLGTAGLKSLPKTLKTAALLDTCPRVRLSVAVYRKLHDAQVNAENVLCINRRGGRQVNRNVQIECAVPETALT